MVGDNEQDGVRRVLRQRGHDLAGIIRIMRMPASLCTGELEIVYGRGKVNYP